MSWTLPADWLIPDWPAPHNVHAVSTSRSGGVSEAPFGALNLSDRVGDTPSAVRTNRARLRTALSFETEPVWLRQVHGRTVVDASHVDGRTEADASVAFSPGPVCAVTTADCLPVLFCDVNGTRVAAAHAGWRGLAAGILEATSEALAIPPHLVLAWLGPAIGAHNFEVGEEVKAAFVNQDAINNAAFKPSSNARWFADIYQLARNRLCANGIHNIYGGGWCTYSDARRFFSYRRDKMTGRMASLIWMSKPK